MLFCSSKFALALQAHGATTAKYLFRLLYHIQERKAKIHTQQILSFIRDKIVIIHNYISKITRKNEYNLMISI